MSKTISGGNDIKKDQILIHLFIFNDLRGMVAKKWLHTHLTYCFKISIALIFWMVETISSGLQFVASISLILSPSKTTLTFLPRLTKATITPATPPIRAVAIGNAMFMYSRLPS
ncbi:hypothetical protein H8S21_00605 [Erwinia persicina]|uniref:hypothetical protein n=1 Tax=Erwinia persicina TaxID=55211 RepID=UPI001654A201|nr:hypothetical protein [Erwinia persicina]MBC3943816.1 hypothetical protein [Erwinia persicina]